MVDTVYWLVAAYIGGLVAQAGWLGPKVSGYVAPFLHASHELSQWLCYDDSTINIIIIIIINYGNNCIQSDSVSLVYRVTSIRQCLSTPPPSAHPYTTLSTT